MELDGWMKVESASALRILLESRNVPISEDMQCGEITAESKSCPSIAVSPG